MLNGESERQPKEPKQEVMVHGAAGAATEDKQRPFVVRALTGWLADLCRVRWLAIE